LPRAERLEMAESLLDALEGSLRIFEKHRILILGQLLRQPSEYRIVQAPDSPVSRDGSANFDDANYTIGRNV